MKLNTLQRQIEDFEKRIEALKILDRAMIANKKL
jgi:chaperonin cofactor prefoldin